MIRQLADLAQQISESKDISLLGYLEKLISGKNIEDCVVAVCESRFIPDVEDSFRNIPGLRYLTIVSDANLKEAICYSHMFVIGSPRWFREYVFSSPRANDIHIIKHQWISGNWEPEFVLISPYKRPGSRVRKLSIEDNTINLSDTMLDDLMPKIDITRIQNAATEQLINRVSDDDEIVIARLFILENEWAVFLEANTDSSVDIIDLEEESSKRIRRASVRELSPGTFLLLRTEGGGDYIVPVADLIMGDFKNKARADQRRWKTLLRERVRIKGITNVIEELRKRGSARASAANVEYWMSFRCKKRRKANTLNGSSCTG